MGEAKEAIHSPQQQLHLAQKMFALAQENALEPQFQVNLLEQAIRLDPFKRLYRLALGRAKHDWGLFEEAIDEFDWALNFWPESREIHLFLGEAQLEAEQYEEARKSFKQVLGTLEGAAPGDELAVRATYDLVECDIRQATDEGGWERVLDSLNQLTPANWLEAGLFCEKCLKLLVECSDPPMRTQAVALAEQHVGAAQPSHPAYQALQRMTAFSPQSYLNDDASAEEESEKQSPLDGLLTAYMLTHLPAGSNEDGEARLHHLGALGKLAESRADRWFGLQEAYLYELGKWAAEEYRSKSYDRVRVLWREAERVAPHHPAILQNLAILYTRLKDEGQYQRYWDQVTHTWTLYGELMQDATSYEKKLLQKHQAFMEGANARFQTLSAGPELLELGLVWAKEAISYFALRQLAFRNAYFRCGVRSDDWAGEHEREEVLQVGYDTIVHWLHLVAGWQSLTERSEIARWRLNQLSEDLTLAKQDTEAAYRFHDEEKDVFGQHREMMAEQYCLLLFRVLPSAAQELGLENKEQRSTYAQLARYVLGFPHRLLRPRVLELIEQLGADSDLETIAQNIAVGPWYHKAQELLKEQPAQAISYLQEVLEIVPDYLPALFYLALASFFREDWDTAEVTARKALKLCTGEDKETQSIKEQLDELLSQFPLVRIAKYIHSALEAMGKKRWTDALAHLNQAQEKLPDAVLVLFYKAVCHFRLEEWDTAEQTAKQAQSLCTGEDKETQSIKEQLKELLSQFPQVRVAKELGSAIAAMGKKRWTDALAYLQQAQAKVPDVALVLFYKAVCLFRLEDWDAAERAAEQALPLCQPGDDGHQIEEQLRHILRQIPQARVAPDVKKARKAMDRKRWAEALPYLDSALSQLPTSVPILFYQAVCQFKLEQWTAAEETANRALLWCRPYADSQIEEQLRQIITQIPLAKIAGYLKQARAAMNKERWAEALRHLDSALYVSPDAVIALYYKALCHLRLKEWATARQVAERSLPRAEEGDTPVSLKEQLRQLVNAAEFGPITDAIKKEDWSTGIREAESCLRQGTSDRALALFYKAVCEFRSTMSRLKSRGISLNKYVFDSVKTTLREAEAAYADRDLQEQITQLRLTIEAQLRQLLLDEELTPITNAIKREEWSTGIREAENCLSRGTTERALVLFYKAVCQFRSTMSSINSRSITPSQSLFDPIETTIWDAERACNDSDLRKQITALRTSVEQVRGQLRSMGIRY